MITSGLDKALIHTMSIAHTQIGFGGGCHWCTEAVFGSIEAVIEVRQGFIRSHSPDDQYSEAVLIDFDERQISIDVLLEIHLRTHASSSAHSMRDKYRSAVYVNDSAMAARCLELLTTLQAQFEKPLVTQVLDMVHFKTSAELYKNYYTSDPERPFCVTYIEPKLALLQREYGPFIKR